MAIKITKKTAGARLDKFLANPDLTWAGRLLSRSQIQKMIGQESIKVNGLPAQPHYLLKPGDVINTGKKPAIIEPADEKGAKSAPEYNLEIIAETDEILVINKPAGLAVHGAAGHTLADWLKIKYPKIKSVGDDPDRPGIVHRLDKDVSGLMAVAKTQAAFDHLKKQFQDRTIIKEYTALVHGKIHKDADVINFPIVRSREGYKMAALPLTVKGRTEERGRRAETEFRIIARLINYTLLKVKIKTGRTHQIRVHLAAYGHPVAGDNIYGTARTRTQNKKLGLSRIFLIADRLGFSGLDNEKKDYKIDLTEELKTILKTVK